MVSVDISSSMVMSVRTCKKTLQVAAPPPDLRTLPWNRVKIKENWRKTAEYGSIKNGIQRRKPMETIKPKSEATPAPNDYLDQIRENLKSITDKICVVHGVPKWSDRELDNYRNSGGWDVYFALGYSPREAVLEDMTYWDD